MLYSENSFLGELYNTYFRATLEQNGLVVPDFYPNVTTFRTLVKSLIKSWSRIPVFDIGIPLAFSFLIFRTCSRQL